jgi:hypothetical protein
MHDKEKRRQDDAARHDAAEAAFRGHDRPEPVEDNRDRKTEKKIDHSLKETFPASDPPSISPGAD